MAPLPARLATLVLGLLLAGPAAAGAQWSPAADAPGTFAGPVARASCGAGSAPETGLQGRVPRAERDSGRSARGYSCNMELVGRDQGPGASWVNPSYDHCAYVSEHYPGTEANPGVRVLDVGDPAHPRQTATLSSPAMLGTWETLKVNAGRKLLAAVSALGPAGQGAGFLDLYDLSDCAHPRLLNSVPGTRLSLPANTFGHEGDFSPDGRTYWSTSAYTGLLTAIDVSDPARPALLFTGKTGTGNHGFGFSPDGTRLYLAEAGRLGSGALLTPLPLDDLAEPNGLQVFDVGELQRRVPGATIHLLGELRWDDGAAGQHAIPVTYGGRPHVVFVDELLSGGPRIIDVGDPTAPRTISKLKLEIQMPEHEALRRADTTAPVLFGYDAHYCTVDRPTDPTALACGEFASGVRVFDIRDPRGPREVAYYNPPAQIGKTMEDLPASEHVASTGDLTTDWCSSPPRFVGSQLWVTCQDNGFMVLRFTHAAFPVTDASARITPCTSRRRFTIRLARGLRGARVRVAGRPARVVRRGGRLTARVDLTSKGRGTVVVRVTGRTRAGRRVSTTRTYHPCRRRA